MSKKKNYNVPHIFVPDVEVGRKEFLRWLGFAGLSVTLPFALSRKAEATCTPALGAATQFPFPLFISIHGGGGWDPTSFCDPKGDANNINRFSAGARIALATSGNYGNAQQTLLAPAWNGSTGANGINWIHQDNVNFITANRQRIRIVNGIDTTTNNHDTGPIYVWSGKISVGHPTIAALVAAARGSSAPLAFINNGGYNYTAGVVPGTQINDINRIKEVARPARQSPTISSQTQTYFSDCTHHRIREFQKARVQGKLNNQTLPRLQESLNALNNARLSTAQLEHFVAEAESIETRRDAGGQFATRYNGNSLFRQFMIARAAWRAGLCASVNTASGGFDTHSNHDASQRTAINRVLDGVRFMAEEASTQDGSLNNIFIAVGSDFGRTPRYNGGNGKDHWPITSMMFLGGAITAGGTVGGTTNDRWYADSNQSPLSVSGGNRLTIKPQHVQNSLRRLLNIHNTNITVRGTTRSVDAMFPLINGSADHIPIFANGV
ncbi:MAG: DUF1501 domain-containing protein [Leptospiraceae bacterium]|nr:DUF1501 domain-containing protein [Leptospiraceae bacterium]